MEDKSINLALQGGGAHGAFTWGVLDRLLDERWLQVFRCTLAVLQIIAGLGIDGDLRDVHDRLVRSDPQVAPQVLRWLADHDAPFVDPRYRTRR